MKKLICLFFCLFMSIANAGLITDLIGDKDCFGLGGICSDGDHYVTDLGGSFFTDNRTLGEVLGVDEWDTTSGLGGPIFTFGLDLGGATALSASIELFTAGIDLAPGADFLFNGVSIGSYFEVAGTNNEAATLIFNVPIGLLLNPDNLTLSLSSEGDGFIIDYIELSVITESTSVPEPTTLVLLALGIAGVGFYRKKKEVG